jgi:exo-beta-1,3-glucanase (GH17 family)
MGRRCHGASSAWLSVALAACAIVGSVVFPSGQSGVVKVHGLNFSPYIDGQNPNLGVVVPLSQIQARVALIAPYVEWIRSFGMTHGLEQIPAVARAHGLKVAAGAWIGRDLAANAQEISNLIAAALAGNVDIAIVGSEALLRNDVSESQLIAYLNQVKQAIPASIPVATADTFDRLLAHPNVVAAGSIVLPNIYSYWMGVELPNALCALESAYQQVVAIAGGRPVWISEAGWPSAGAPLGAAIPSAASAATYFNQFVSWARARGVPFWYFSALDEEWKAAYEGSAGPHWGVFDKHGVMKPGMQPVFDGVISDVDCNGLPGGPGTPSITFTYVPPVGTNHLVRGRVLHVSPATHQIVHYIRVAGRWWVKPTAAQPTVPFFPDGSYSAQYATGGNDTLATDLVALVIPNDFSPPVLLGASALPADLLQAAVAMTQATRTADAISGTVTSSGQPMKDVLVALTQDGAASVSVLTASDGRYSFPSLTGTGTRTIVPSFPNHVFTPPSATFPTVSGNHVANFTGAPASTTPGAPTITLITPGNGQLGVAFTAGATGGAALTNYEYSTDGGTTWTVRSPAATTSPLAITGLTNGTTYQVQLRAVNVNGAGTATLSTPGTPSTTPGASRLLVDFGPAYGEWILNDGTGWSSLHAFSPEDVVAGDLDDNGVDEIILDFGSTWGTWVWANNAGWYQLNTVSPVAMGIADLDHNGRDDVILSFNTHGVYIYYNDTSWSHLHPMTATTVATGRLDGTAGADVLLNFPGQGLWQYLNNSSWAQLHHVNATIFAVGNMTGSPTIDEVVVDFGSTYGLWYRVDGTSWAQLTSLSATKVALGNIDATANTELVADFGPTYGVWVARNGPNWENLHPFPAEGLIVGDLDGNGRGEVAIDFGATYGLWLWVNDTSWAQANTVSPEGLAIADLTP